MRVRSWIDSRSSPHFYLAGYAGTGKTTLALRLTESVEGAVLFGAFTGKAASVMRERGCEGATTIHRLIYQPKIKSARHLQELESALAEAEGMHDADRAREIRSLVARERDNLERPAFSLDLESQVRDAALVVVDEVSMVGRRMGEDLLSFGTPVLVLGDPAQLPPVREEGYFTAREPDFLLTEVHRQAEGSPIIHLATLARRGQALPLGEHGASRVVQREAVTVTELLHHDQVICGRNETRRRMNAKMRRLLGRQSELPEAGDRLVCLRNDHDLGLLNGSVWTCRESRELGDEVLLTVESEDGVLSCSADAEVFRGQPIRRGSWGEEPLQAFDFGYALTCHKAQGSQWASVAVLDEGDCFGHDASRWRYTAVTRASERVTVVRM